MPTPLHQRLWRALRWAFLGRPPRTRVGRLARPTSLYVEVAVTAPDEVEGLDGAPAAWVKIQLVELQDGVGETADALREALLPSPRGPEGTYKVVRELVRGGDLAIETAHGEPLLLRAGTFDVPHVETEPPLRLSALPPEVSGLWPGRADARRFYREVAVRRGDFLRFEALFVPERHPRTGEGYRGEVDVRHRIEGDGAVIPLEIAARRGQR